MLQKQLQFLTKLQKNQQLSNHDFNFIKAVIDMNIIDKPATLANPQAKTIFQQPKPSFQTLPLQQMIPTVKIILNKNPQSRSNAQNKILNKFSKKSSFFSAIAEYASPDVARNVLKQARIYQIMKNRIVMSKGTDVENIVLMLKGKFGITQIMDNAKFQAEKQQSLMYKKIIQNSLKIARDLKRKIKQVYPQAKNVQFKTTKAAMYDIVIQKYIEQQEQVFNLSAIAEGKKYTQTIITCKDSILLSVPAKVLYDNLASFVRKQKSDKISAFRKFQYFNSIENQRLIQLVDQLPLLTAKKGNYIYKQGQPINCIYLLIKGSFKITKTVDLFKQNPNLFYINRQKIAFTHKLPFADFSQIYNYKPRSKVLQIGITNEGVIFGEQQFFTQEKVRQANAQVSSQTAVYYLIDLDKLENTLPDIKNFTADLKAGLYKNQTQKKIMYRQQKLSEILICEAKNNMDYFFIQENTQNSLEFKLNTSPRKYKISKVNSLISPTKKQKVKQTRITQAAFNTFNFNKFPLNINSTQKKFKQNRSLFHFTQEQNKVIELIHTVTNRQTEPSSPQKPQSKSKRHSSTAKNIHIDIHHPLFEMGYFEKNRKQALRIQKQSRMRPLATPQKSTIKTNVSRGMSLSIGF